MPRRKRNSLVQLNGGFSSKCEGQSKTLKRIEQLEEVIIEQSQKIKALSSKLEGNKNMLCELLYACIFVNLEMVIKQIKNTYTSIN